MRGTNADQPVLVIGGTRGTGLLIARALARGGRRVRALSRDPDRALSLLGPTVDIAPGDVTKPDTLPAAVAGAAHVVFTAGVAMGLAREPFIIATEYYGVRNTLEAMRQAGFVGRFLYMTSIGVTRRSLTADFLDLIKGKTLRWRRRAEDDIRASGVDYTIIRAGMLLNGPGGRRAIEVSQEPRPLSPLQRIARADVAETFVEALERPGTSKATFEVVWGRGPRERSWDELLGRLRPDR